MCRLHDGGEILHDVLYAVRRDKPRVLEGANRGWVKLQTSGQSPSPRSGHEVEAKMHQ